MSRPKLTGIHIEMSWRPNRTRRFIIGKLIPDYYMLRRLVMLGKITIWITRDYEYTLEEWLELQEKNK